jgi:BirA family biotin operon repressor/biotin-[acetyl-CoA-carboxylase] ligase
LIAGHDTVLPPIDLIQLREIDSTSSEAARRLEAGETQEFAIMADSQTAGRGRQGRRWVSSMGNLFLSAAIHPGIGMDRAGELAFVAALAVGRALADLDVDFRFKWPNDILAHDAKLCGILIENRIEGVAIAASVIGIGVNLKHAPEGVPYPATSVASCGGRDIDCPVLARSILDHLQAVRTVWPIQGFAAIAAEWNRAAWRHGRRVTIDNGVDTVSGIFAGLSEQGALRLVTETGPTDIYSGSLLYQDAA